MRIILSPSKTMAISGSGISHSVGEVLANRIAMHLAQLSTADIMKFLKLKEDKAIALKNLYRDFNQAAFGIAGSSFTGLAFKSLDWNSLSDDAKEFSANHLVILSGLYGILRPTDMVKAYRLDFENRIFKNISNDEWESFEEIVSEPISKHNLTSLWAPIINRELAMDDLIINLASKEYSAAVNHPNMHTVIFEDFKGGKWKQMSTSSKKMRGAMARFILENKILKIEGLPDFINGYKLHKQVSKVITYRKIIEA